MAKAARAGATAPVLPDEIVLWEILVRLPPKSLLRCRPVCRAWRRVTSTRDFLLAHHARQPFLPIVCGLASPISKYYNILAFDHRATPAAHLQPVARIGEYLSLDASCDGLLVLGKAVTSSSCFFVCNPATREHAPIWKACGSRLLGMYRHRPTGEYRLLLHWSSDVRSFLGHPLPNGKIGGHVLALGSHQPIRYIEGAETASVPQFESPALIRDSLHWYRAEHQHGNELLLVFDTIVESFRQMRPPPVDPCPTRKLHIIEMEGTLGICGYIDAMKIDIWMLQNYEGEVWEHKYQVKLPVVEMRQQFGGSTHDLYVSVVSMDGDVFLLLRYDRWMFYVDTGGKLVGSFHHDSQQLYPCKLRLKQTLVPHTFLMPIEGRALSDLPYFAGYLGRHVFMSCDSFEFH